MSRILLVTLTLICSFQLSAQNLGVLDISFTSGGASDMYNPWNENGIQMQVVPYPGAGCFGSDCFDFSIGGVWVYPATLEAEIPTGVPIGSIEVDLTDWCGFGCTELLLEFESGASILKTTQNAFVPETVVFDDIPPGEVPIKLSIGSPEAYIQGIRISHGRLAHSYSGPLFPEKILTTSTSGKSFGVTADGSNVSIFTLLTLDDDWVLSLTGFDPQVDGKLTLIGSSTHQKTYRFEHPKELPAGSNAKRTVSLAVLDGWGGSVITSYPMDIWRCPVILVHGLNSSAAEFKPMEDALVASGRYQRHLISRANYSSTNQLAFGANGLVPIQQIRAEIKLLYNRRISAGRADVVGHSMGGILARISELSPINKGNIRRIITLNTPHAGTQLANLARDESSKIRSAICSVGISLNNYLCLAPAARDLSVQSDALLSLNGTVNQDPVPVHAIATKKDNWYFGLNIQTGWWVPELLSFGLVKQMYDGLFDQSPHDLVVPVPSQYGGLGSSFTQLIDDQAHIGSSGNASVMSAVLNLLLESENGPSYGTTGFHPPVLTYKGSPLPIRTEDEIDLSRGDLSISITAPNTGSIYKPGDLVMIEAIGSSDLQEILFFMDKGPNDSYRFKVDGPSGSIAIPLDSLALGNRTIIAVGIDTLANQYAIDTIQIVVDAKDPILGIKVYPDSIYSSVGQTTFLTVEADFGSYLCDISRVEGLTFALTNTRAEYDGGIGINGLKIGLDTLVIHYGGKSSSIIPMEIFQEDTLGLPLWISFDKVPDACGQKDGMITAMPHNGVPPYSIMWEDGSTSLSRSGLESGIYSLTVSDNWGLVVTRTVELEASESPNVAILGKDATCGMDNGSINLVITKGLPPFQIAWENGDSTQVLEQLSAGNYAVTVTDAAGCSSTGIVTIGSVLLPMINIEGTSPSCDQSDGDLFLVGDVGEIQSVLWSTGDTILDLSGLSGGSYSVSITDNLGCLQTDSFTLVNRISPVFNLGPDTTLVEGETLLVGYPDDLPGWIYNWSTGDMTPTIIISEQGLYGLTVINPEDCSWSDSLSVSYTTSLDDFFNRSNGKLYSNPVTDLLNLEIVLQRVLPIGLQIVDEAGQVVSNLVSAGQVGENHFIFDTRNLMPGYYTLLLKCNGESFGKQFIKVNSTK